jgi:ADP-L-glycero-D-manno-heptose 6-epimerase
VYGAGSVFREERAHEAPLNVYGYSKFLFDQYVRRVLPDHTAPLIGFRYFNVYGPREQHKGRMASVVHHFLRQYAEHGAVRLFEGSGGYAAGEQRRDFVSVDDVVKVNLHFLGGRDRSGIYNLGTGRATSFNEVAAAVVNACRAREGQPPRTVAGLVAAGAIVYVPFPADLAGKYQSFTQADLARLRAAGYTAPMLAIEEGVRRYAEGLITPAP